MLDRGRLCFRGSPTELIARAAGVAWQIRSDDGSKPDHRLTIVSTLHLADGVQHRVVGADASQYPHAIQLQPSLEDGYVWLMQGARTAESRD